MQMYCLNKMRILIGSDCRMDWAEPSKLRQYIIICSPTPWKRGKWASARSLRQKKRADLTIIHLFRVICFVTQYISMYYIQMLLLQTYKKDSVFLISTINSTCRPGRKLALASHHAFRVHLVCLIIAATRMNV